MADEGDRGTGVLAAIDGSEAVLGLVGAKGDCHIVIGVIAVGGRQQRMAAGAGWPRVREHVDGGAEPALQDLLLG